MVKIFGHFLPGPKLLLALSEALLLSAVLAGVVVPASLIELSLVPSIILITAMISVGAYNYDVLVSVRLTITRLTVALILAAPVICFVLLFQTDAAGTMHTSSFRYGFEIVLAWALALIIIRTVFLKLVSVQRFKRRVVVVGNGKLAARILNRNTERLNCHFTAVPFATDDGDSEGQATDFGRSHLSDWESLRSFVYQHRAHEIVVATEDYGGPSLKQLLSSKVSGVKILDYHSFWERESCQLDLDTLEREFSTVRTGVLDSAMKRAFDFVISVAMLILSAPLLLLAAIAIKLEDGGSIFYRQERVGLGGKKFWLLKFRSMSVDAESKEPQWARCNDPRVTRVGSVMRNFRIDELPQLFNVLRSEMSFIGPRPERPYFVDWLSRQIPFYNERHAVKPGITGWAQIRYQYGASLEDARQKHSYDLYYIKNRTLFLDLLILIETVRIVLFPHDVRQYMTNGLDTREELQQTTPSKALVPVGDFAALNDLVVEKIQREVSPGGTAGAVGAVASFALASECPQDLIRQHLEGT
jgi:sugar transferase (PEP-CTERM system associated)